ncbi:MAG: peptide ABC transporter, partial [Candidatus Rokuibacteriota bacterium]
WWSSPKKEAALQKFTGSVSLAERKTAWSEIQRLYYEEAAAVKIGDAYGLSVIQKRVQGFTNVDYPPFWNIWLTT